MSLELVSIHVPKAAGTSLTRALQRHFGPTLLLDYGRNPFQSPEPAPVKAGPEVRAVHGHFHAGRYTSARKAFSFTFLREPVDNLISIYFYWKSLPAAPMALHQRFQAERPSLLEFARYPAVSELGRLFFGGFDMARLDFIGFYETRTADLTALTRLTSIDFDPLLRVNRTNPLFDQAREAVKADATLMGELRGLLAEDVAFYEAALERRGGAARPASPPRHVPGASDPFGPPPRS